MAEAEPLLLQAIALRPELGVNWLELGILHDRQGKLEQALADYERARALQPRNYRIFYFRAKTLAKLNRRPEAIQSGSPQLRIASPYFPVRECFPATDTPSSGSRQTR